MISQDEVNAQVEKLCFAMISADREMLTNLAADTLSYGHSNGNVENKDEFVENIASGRSVFVTIELSDQSVSIVNDTAIVRHTFHSVTNNGGVPGEITLKIILVWQHIGTGLKLIARQAVRINN